MVPADRNDGPVLAAVVRGSLTVGVTFELRCLMRRSRAGGSLGGVSQAEAAGYHVLGGHALVTFKGQEEGPEAGAA